MSALASYRTAVLQLLDDTGLLRYTNLQVDQALRWALGQYSRSRPIMRTYSADGAGTYILELPADFTAFNITRIQMDDGTDPPTEVAFKAFYRDESWYVETTERLLASSDTVTVTYDAPHTIDDLDSAAGTTIPDAHEWLIQVGAAGYAARMRAVSRAETVNMQPEVRKQLMEMANQFLTEFSCGIKTVQEVAISLIPDSEDD